ncbi:MAG: YidC/Oxa1 family membrane protein insertase [Rubrobacteraceae bacterium]
MLDFLGTIFRPLTDLMGNVLQTFHSLGAPWWLSILFLTLIVRGLLFPLTVKQVKNMRNMQELKPDMDEIRTRYKDDRQKQQQAMMDLYKERNVNPMAGFLPILIQMPVFIVMYHVIRNFEETVQSFSSGGLFWFQNLTQHDPYFILPILSASILVGAQEIASKNVSGSQKNLMRVMPIMFTAFIAKFPAGLFVYWITSNSFTLVQNYLIYHRGPGKHPPITQTSQASPEATTATEPASRTTEKTTVGAKTQTKPPAQKTSKSGPSRRRKKKKKR